MKVKLCNSLFEVAIIREQTDTTGQAKLSERPKWRISVKLTIWLAHLYQFVPGTNPHKWEASFGGFWAVTATVLLTTFIGLTRTENDCGH